ncbi:MAG: PilN domain-containing protein [Wenzhouxiangellaceae bacterium]
MRTINLLPWREEKRREAQKNFIIILIIAAVTASAVVLGVSRFYDARVENQNTRNQYLRSEIAKLDRQIAQIAQVEDTRARLLQRKQVIEDLQANRSLMVRLFDQLVRTVPDGIRLVNARQVGEQITITGVSQSNARISTYLRNLESSQVLHAPRLRIIEAEVAETDAQLPFGFSVAATVALPKQLESRDEESTP